MIRTFQCTDEQEAALQAMADDRNTSVSQLIRDILAVYIPAFRPAPPPTPIAPETK